MAIPITYNIRNLIVRKTTTIMTALGIALTVAVLLAVMALVHGLRVSLTQTGDPLHVLVLRNGANSELVSTVTRDQFQALKFKPGIARDAKGDPLASLELVTIINLASVDAPDGINVNVRGLSQAGLSLRKDVKLDAGDWFNPGRREVVVGKAIQRRFPDAHLGANLHFGKGDWKVVGIMSAGDSAINSEIFADANQIASDFNRNETLSSVLLRATDEVTAAALVKSIAADQRVGLSAMSEKDYYAGQTSGAAPIQALGTFVAIIMAVGSSFAAMNTMYAAVARRSREVGTLRVLGFSRGSILLSFFGESILLSLIGGVLGILLVLPLNGVTTGIGNFTTFSETSFRLQVSPAIMVTGIVFAMALGAFGGFFPARNAANKEILTALREV